MTRNGAVRSSVRHWVTLWLASAAVLAYLCRQCLAVAESSLRAELDLTEAQMGLLLGPAFFWTYALAQIPTAVLGERYGSRRMLPLFAGAWSVACGVVALAAGFPVLLLSRLTGGLAQAGLFPCAVRTVSIWQPHSGRAFASGTLGASMSVGGAISAGLTGWLLTYFAATTIFGLFALPGLLWAIGFAWWFRDRPEDHAAVTPAELALIRGTDLSVNGEEIDNGSDASSEQADCQPAPPEQIQTVNPAASVNDSASEETVAGTPPLSTSQMWLSLLLSPAAWLICAQQFFRAAGYAFFASWFATYLIETRGVSTAESGVLTALPLIATVLGSLCGGYASDTVLRWTGSLTLARKGIAAASLSICGVLVLLAFFISHATLAVMMISAGAFLAASAGPCAYTVTMDMGGRHVASLFSTMNMIGNFGAGLSPLLVPRFKTWVEATPSLLSLCDGNSWNAVLPMFAAMYFGAALCWGCLSTRGTVFDQSFRGRRS